VRSPLARWDEFQHSQQQNSGRPHGASAVRLSVSGSCLVEARREIGTSRFSGRPSEGVVWRGCGEVLQQLARGEVLGFGEVFGLIDGTREQRVDLHGPEVFAAADVRHVQQAAHLYL